MYLSVTRQQLTVDSYLMHTSQHFQNPVFIICMHFATSVPISHFTAPKTLPVLSSAVASITPTWPSWGPRLRTSLGFNVCKACLRMLSYVSGDASASQTLQELHWLPFKWRIDYKLATLMYKLLESGEPIYLRSCITSKIFRRLLRSTVDDRQLESCPSRTRIGSCAFRSATPAIWNSLPHDIRASPSVSIFRSRLKRHYFKHAF